MQAGNPGPHVCIKAATPTTNIRAASIQSLGCLSGHGVGHAGANIAALGDVDAQRDMPEEFDLTQLQEFSKQHNISRDEVTDALGGSP